MRHKTICYIKPVPNILEPLIPHFKRSFPYVDRILFIRSISLIMYNIYSSIMQNTVIFHFANHFHLYFVNRLYPTYCGIILRLFVPR